MKMSDSLENAFNDHLKAEFASHYTYLQMSAWFDEQNLLGISRWMRAQAEEELQHAMKVYDFILTRGNRVRLRPMPSPGAEFESALDCFEVALEHERSVTEQIHKLYTMATEENDYGSFALLQWFVAEQVEEENTVTQIIEQLRMIIDYKPGLIMLDRELGERSPVNEMPPA